jgi:HJR/Mrr/RecB family endonuclease
MFSSFFKKEFKFKSELTSEGVKCTLHDSKNREYSLPLDEQVKNDLYKWEPGKLKVIEQVASMVQSLSDIEINDELIQEFSSVFDREDLIRPIIEFSNGSIVIPFKTVAALRFNNLSEELGLDFNILESFSVPDYSKLKIEIKTIGSFNEPLFRIDAFIYDRSGNLVYIDKIRGHLLISDRGDQYFLTPSLKKLIERMDEHRKLVKDGLLDDNLNARYQEFSEIKKYASFANALLDSYLESEEVYHAKDLSFIMGRGPDEEVILQEALPLEYSNFDIEFVKQLDALKKDENPSKLVLKSKSGKRLIVSLSEKAWKSQRIIARYKNSDQKILEEIFQNPSDFLSGVNRTALGGTFSDRVSGFIFGKPQNANGRDDQSGSWTVGHDDYSLLMRSVNGAAVPLQTTPAPEIYKTIKAYSTDLAQQIDDEEINKRLENEAYLTPLPPQQDKLVYISEYDAEFNLTTLINTCKRIETENIPELFDDEIDYAAQILAEAVSNEEALVEWVVRDGDDEIKKTIPTQSLKLAIPVKSQEKNETQSVSLKIDEDVDLDVEFDLLQNKSILNEPPPNFKEGINLYPHQKEGFAWLKTLFNGNRDRSGALLADDMGVGKTIQVISLISYVKSLKGKSDKPILIVAPVSLLDGSWINEGVLQFVEEEFIQLGPGANSLFEIKKYSNFQEPYSKKALYNEAFLLNEEMSSEGKSLLDCNLSSDLRSYLDNVASWCGNNIIVTSYETLRSRSIELGCVDFSLVILDEAQKIKNHGTLQSNAARALKGDMYIAMTGTPIENSIMDLYSIMDFVYPSKLGTRDDFRKKYFSGLVSAPAGSEERDKLKNELLDALKPLWFRRTKNDVFEIGKDLPHIHHYDKVQNERGEHVNVDLVKMSKRQRNAYEDQVGLFQNAKKGQKLSALRGMLEACHSPWLTFGSEVSWGNREELFNLCPKLEQTFKILETIYNRSEEKGRKVILFANVVQVQNSLAWLIRDWVKIEKNETIEVEVYNGKPTPSSREAMLKRFKEKPGFQALVISPRAGGAGLNIQFANNVVHYTREWNPALERQATDRVYRIGQKRDVHVHYPTTSFGEVGALCAEEELANILARKRDVMEDFTMVVKDIGVDEFSSTKNTSVEDENIHIGVGELGNIDDKMFEGYVACVFDHLGYQSKVVGKSGDRGADIVCLSPADNILIQAKHTRTKRSIHSKCIDEVRGAKSYYESQYDKQFRLLAITNHCFHQSTFNASEMGDSVDLWDLNKIMENIKGKKFTLTEIKRKIDG